jgi:hypothetical protein
LLAAYLGAVGRSRGARGAFAGSSERARRRSRLPSSARRAGTPRLDGARGQPPLRHPAPCDAAVARCSTCRAPSTAPTLPASRPDERRTLERVRASWDVGLRHPLRLDTDITVVPLFSAQRHLPGACFTSSVVTTLTISPSVTMKRCIHAEECAGLPAYSDRGRRVWVDATQASARDMDIAALSWRAALWRTDGGPEEPTPSRTKYGLRRRASIFGASSRSTPQGRPQRNPPRLPLWCFATSRSAQQSRHRIQRSDESGIRRPAAKQKAVSARHPCGKRPCVVEGSLMLVSNGGSTASYAVRGSRSRRCGHQQAVPDGSHVKAGFAPRSGTVPRARHGYH